MTDCNATLTTATETGETVGRSFSMNTEWGEQTVFMPPYDIAMIRRGDRLVRLDVTCDETGGPHECSAHWDLTGQHECVCGVMWFDRWKGATPHTPPAESGLPKADPCGCVNGMTWAPHDHPDPLIPCPHTPPADVCPHCRSACNAGHERFTGCYECDQCSPPADVCPRCDGDGADPRDLDSWDHDCPSCGGTGDRPAATCDQCDIDLGHNWHVREGKNLCDPCFVSIAYGTGDRSTVTDAQVDAAADALGDLALWHVRAALEAAAAVKKEKR